jgi:hypothetical protein
MMSSDLVALKRESEAVNEGAMVPNMRAASAKK